MVKQRSTGGVRPVARFDRLVVTETADEVLLYDTEKHHIHHLNATTAAVWRHCDGQHSVVDLARDASRELGATVDEATVRLALTTLDDAGLLEQPLVSELRMSRLSRRAFMQRAGVAGAIAVPAIVSTTMSANATQSPQCPQPCGVPSLTETQCPKECPYCVKNECRADKCGKRCTGHKDCRDQRCSWCNPIPDRNDGICVEPPQFAASERQAAPAPITTPTLAVWADPASANPGGIVTVGVDGFVDDAVSVFIGGILVATLTTDGSGSGSLTTAVPADLPAGTHDLVARGGSDEVYGAAFTVLGAPEPQASSAGTETPPAETPAPAETETPPLPVETETPAVTQTPPPPAPAETETPPPPSTETATATATTDANAGADTSGDGADG